MTRANGATVIWHDLECGSYAADLPLWREFAAAAAGPVLEIGAGAGRVTLDLARGGHQVTALDHDEALLAALTARARAEGLRVETVVADAREFEFGRRFDLAIVPMQTVQLLGGADGRAAFLRCARRHLAPGALLALAVADALEHYDEESLPLPDTGTVGGVRYSSQPVAVRAEGDALVIERIREAVAADGTRSTDANVIRLDRVDSESLTREAKLAGLQPLTPRHVEETDEHVGSEVVLLRS